jgi:integrase
MASGTQGGTRTCARRLGPHHFAYLRAWVEGLPREDAARRYLGLEHGHQLLTLHRQVIDELRATARRRGDSRWRLVGIEVGAKSGIHERKNSVNPPLEAWAAEHGLADFSYSDQLEAYLEAFPADVSAERKGKRNARLRQRQLEVLSELEHLAAVPVAESDPIAAWLEPGLTQKLLVAGYATLGDLARAVRRGDRWYRAVKGVGVGKARRVELHLATLLGETGSHEIVNSRKLESMNSGRGVMNSATPTINSWSPALNSVPLAMTSVPAVLDGSSGANRAMRSPTIDATNDKEAVEAWLAATAARSPATRSAYRKEAERFLLWSVMERNKALSSCNSTDCLAYMAFLNRIPDEWQSRRKATRLGLGWTPFRGPLGLESRRTAVKVLHRLFGWLTDRRYLDDNPWAGVDRGLVDGDEMPSPPESRAFTREAFAALSASLPNQAKPGATRNGFLLHFGRYTGLRASEMLATTLDKFERTEWGWRVFVVGKGRKPRHVSVPSPALEVLNQYLEARGLVGLAEYQAQLVLEREKAVPGASPACPSLLGLQSRPLDCPTYSAVHQSFTAFVRSALRASDLPMGERLKAQKATQHWLRHTYATRAAEAETPPDVLQAELGHSDPATTAGYYKAQERRRQEAMERASMS